MTSNSLEFKLIKNKLVLPKLQAQSELNFSRIKPAHTPLEIEVSDEFVNIWNEGPQTKIKEHDLKRCLTVLCRYFNVLVKTGQGRVKVDQKTSPNDLVTEVDRGIEMLLRMWIKFHLPHHKIIGEEGTKEAFEAQDWVWYIDPVDGTTNFVDGNAFVALHVGCYQGGKNVLSIVGLPVEDVLYVAGESFAFEKWMNHKKVNWEIPSQFQPFLGTEYMETRPKEVNLFNCLSTDLNLKPYRIKSIGINLIHLMEGKVTAFYKPNVKLWDAFPPLGVLDGALKGVVTIELVIVDAKTQKPKSFYPFSNHTDLVLWINNAIRKHSRVGLVMAYPKNRPDVRESVMKCVFG